MRHSVKNIVRFPREGNSLQYIELRAKNRDMWLGSLAASVDLARGACMSIVPVHPGLLWMPAAVLVLGVGYDIHISPYHPSILLLMMASSQTIFNRTKRTILQEMSRGCYSKETTESTRWYRQEADKISRSGSMRTASTTFPGVPTR